MDIIFASACIEDGITGIFLFFVSPTNSKALVAGGVASKSLFYINRFAPLAFCIPYRILFLFHN